MGWGGYTQLGPALQPTNQPTDQPNNHLIIEPLQIFLLDPLDFLKSGDRQFVLLLQFESLVTISSNCQIIFQPSYQYGLLSASSPVVQITNLSCEK